MILVSEVFGVELFEYKNEAERSVVLVANGDSSLAASWDGEA